MSDDALHDAAPKATKSLFATIGFILIMVGVELMVERAGPRWFPGIVLFVLGAACFYLAWVWKHIRSKLSDSTQTKIARIAMSPWWWLGAVFLLVEIALLSPLVEGGRWPFALWFGTTSSSAAIGDSQISCDSTAPRIRFARDSGHILAVDPYTIIRPEIDPGVTPIINAEIVADEVDRLESGIWKKINSERFQLYVAVPSGTTKQVSRLATSAFIGLVKIPSDNPTRAFIDAGTAYGSWNGDFTPYGKYRLHLILIGDGISGQRFTIDFSWFGSAGTFDLEGACPNG
jgi:hypothetical protein